MQNTNNLSNKSMLIAGITTIILGIILGVITIIINLNKYVNNLNKYTEETKNTIETKISINDNNYDNYVNEIKRLNEDKQVYQKELSTATEISDIKILEAKISAINNRLEELEKLKYSSLTEKNELRKEYSEALKILDEKESSKSLIKCYLVGFAIIIVTINTGAYFIHLAFKPDIDDIILKQQKKIDEEHITKYLQLQNAILEKNKIDIASTEFEKSNTSKVTSNSKKKVSNSNSKRTNSSKISRSTVNVKDDKKLKKNSKKNTAKKNI